MKRQSSSESMRSPAIDILVPNFEDLGAQRVAINAANGLYALGYNVRVVVFTNSGPFRSYLHSGLPVCVLGERVWNVPKLRVVLWLLEYLRLVRSGANRIAISFSPITNVLAGGARVAFPSRIRAVVQEHGYQSVALKERESTPLWFEVFYRWFLVRLYRRCDVFLTIADAIADDFVTRFGIPAARVKVIRNPVDVDGIERMLREPLKTGDSQVNGRDMNCEYIIGVGRLVEQKNFAFLVRVLARLRAGGRGTRLRLVGTGPHQESLQALAAELGVSDSVELLGFQANPYKYMAAARAFCLTSNWEGLPQVIAEAMVCGVPVVARACPSGPSEMLRAGVTGVLVDCDADEDTFARAVSDLLDAPERRATMALEAAKQARAEYGLSGFIEAYVEMITGLEGK